MRNIFLTAFLALSAFTVTAIPLPSWLDVSKDGTFRIEKTTFRLINFGPSYSIDTLQAPRQERNEEAILFSGRFRNAAFRAEFLPRSADAFSYRAELTADSKPVELFGLFLEFRISGAVRTVTIDGKPFLLPEKPEKERIEVITKRKCTQVTIPLDSGARLSVSGKSELKIRDNRPSGMDTFSVRLYFQPSTGLREKAALSLLFRLQPLQGTPIDLIRAANIGFADEFPGDGKGGWTDQGPHNDLRSFTLRTLPVGGTRFRIIDPAKNNGKAAIGLGRNFPREVSLPVSGRGSHLLVLHATGWTRPEKAGEFEVLFADGSIQRIAVISNRDVGNWWNPDHLPNGVVVWRGDNRNAGIGLYFSQFKLDRDDPVKMTLRGVRNQYWLIPALTLADGAIPLQGNDRPVVITEEKEWIRLNTSRTIKPGSPLDFSGMLDAPAGKYGRVVVAPDGHFTFEKAPEKRIRFVGVNLCNRAQFLSHKESDELAERLARHGYNAIRLHHHDNLLVKKEAPDSLTIDPEMLDRLEYLFAACRKRGIYITTDVFVSRRLKAGDNIPEWVPNGKGYQMKALLPISRAAMENWKEFARRWMTHRNPYTGLTWAEDPALVCVNLINEDTLPFQWNSTPETARLYMTRFAEWAKANGCAGAQATEGSRMFRKFLHELQRASYREQIRFLREELQMKTLLTSLNYINEAPLTLLRNEFDLVDNHLYFDHPTSLEKPWQAPFGYTQRCAIEQYAPLPRDLMPTRIFDKPFLVTEFNYCFPNRHRAEGGPLIGAYSALQNWSGLCRFAWSHGKAKIANPQHPVEGFDAVNDPFARLSDRIAVLLFRRGDVKAGCRKFVRPVRRAIFDSAESFDFPMDFQKLGLISQIGSAPDDALPGTEIIRLTGKMKLPAGLPGGVVRQAWERLQHEKVAVSDTGELRLNPKAKTFSVASARSESVTLPGGALRAGVFGVKGATGFQTAAAMSLDGKPLAESASLLIIHLTDVCNTDAWFGDQGRKVLKHRGKLPLLVRRVKAEAELATGNSYRIDALGPDGQKLGEVTGRSENGTFRFLLDPGHFPGGIMAYHLTR